jgi:hypothetical protein
MKGGFRVIGMSAFLFSLASCSSTTGDGAAATSNVNVDLSGAVNLMTPRGCATPAGIYPYGNGPAGQWCQVMTPWGPAYGQTVK